MSVASPYSRAFIERLGQAMKKPRHEALIKSLGSPKAGTRVLDVFGGWRREALLMAAAGLWVESWEIEPQVHQAFLDSHKIFPKSLLENIQAQLGNGVERAQVAKDFDLLYLDPMFAEEGTSSALPKKEMQALRELTQNQEVAFGEIWELCQNSNFSRRVLKWPGRKLPQEFKKQSIIEGSGFRYIIFS